MLRFFNWRVAAASLPRIVTCRSRQYVAPHVVWSTNGSLPNGRCTGCWHLPHLLCGQEFPTSLACDICVHALRIYQLIHRLSAPARHAQDYGAPRPASLACGSRGLFGGPCDEVFGLALGAGDQLFGIYLYTAAVRRPDRSLVH